MPNKAKPDVIERMRFERIEERELKTFAFSNVAELLGESGLVESSAAIEYLRKAPMARVEAIASDLFDFLEPQQSGWSEENVSLVEPFNSLASGSLRGLCMLTARVPVRQARCPRTIRSDVR